MPPTAPPDAQLLPALLPVPPPPVRIPPAVTVSVQLTYHSTLPPPPGSKAKAKDKKESKTKELTSTITPTLEGYTAFLNSILAKHGEEKYSVMERKHYPFKVLCPPAKSYVMISLSRR